MTNTTAVYVDYTPASEVNFPVAINQAFEAIR